MRRYIILTSVVIAAVSLLLANQSTGDSLAATSGVVISENTSAGKITVETDTTRAVWHYKLLAVDNYNQSGGNLYELYYKPMDPGLSRNLVSYANRYGWGNGSSTGIWPGIGGVGSTIMYATTSPPSSQGDHGFGDAVADNNNSGILENHSAIVNAQGNAELTFTYRVRNSNTGDTWYRVVKKWTVEPQGRISLKIDWTILKSGYLSEVGIRNNWSYDVGWNRFAKYGHDWMSGSGSNYRLGSAGIDGETSECWNLLNQFHPDWVSFSGSSIAPTVVMEADNDGQGYAGSGLHKLGLSIFNSPASSTMEQCTIRSPSGIGAHTMSWMAWWGGNPPPGSRYRFVASGTQWSDSFTIDLIQGSRGDGPDVSGVALETVSTVGARIQWSTDTASTSVIRLRNSNGSWVEKSRDDSLVTSHVLSLGSLTPNTTYVYRVTSTDATGRTAVSGDYTFTTSATSAYVISLSESSTIWESYPSYAARDLLVTFRLENDGIVPARDVVVNGAQATNQVVALNGLPASLGDIAPGESREFDILFNVPQGVNRFRVNMDIDATE